MGSDDGRGIWQNFGKFTQRKVHRTLRNSDLTPKWPALHIFNDDSHKLWIQIGIWTIIPDRFTPSAAYCVKSCRSTLDKSKLYHWDLKKQGDSRNSLVLLGVTPSWHVAQWVSRAPTHHTLPAFLNLNGIYFKFVKFSWEHK